MRPAIYFENIVQPHKEGSSPMIQKMTRLVLLCAALASLTVFAVSASSQQAPSQAPDQGSQQQSTKSITGTVAAIGSGGHSFTLEVADGSNGKRTMEFVMGKTTQVQGQVKTGTPVTVEYQAMASGENVAVSVTAQG
jgi:hypothetical protein